MPSKVEYSTASNDQTAFYDEEYDDTDGQVGDGDIEINVEDYLRAARRQVRVTRKNKLICAASFVLLIIAICGYVAGLATFQAKSDHDVMQDLHFKSPAEIIYFLMFSDIIASVVGIWTCLKRTGPQPMIYACIWLLLSSLVNLCVTISLTFETKLFKMDKDKRCAKGKTNTEECTVYTKATVILWCSLLSFVLKLIVIALCRINFPQVFNWMMGKDVYVDEEVLPEANTKIISNAGALAGAYFDPPDLARIAARGSLEGTSVVGKSSNSQAFFVTRDDSEDKPGVELGDTIDDGTPMKAGGRRSTFVSL